MPEVLRASRAVDPLRSSPIALQRLTEEPTRWAALAMLWATPPRVCRMMAGFDVCGDGSAWFGDEGKGA
jgi:hypothetical protein